MSKMMDFAAPSAPSRPERQALPAPENGLYVGYALDTCLRVGPFTMTSRERIQALSAAMKYVVLNRIPGEGNRRIYSRE